MLDHLQRQHWMRRARALARSGAYANFAHLDEELRSLEGYAAAADFLHEPANRYQLTLLCEQSSASERRTGTSSDYAA